MIESNEVDLTALLNKAKQKALQQANIRNSNLTTEQLTELFEQASDALLLIMKPQILIESVTAQKQENILVIENSCQIHARHLDDAFNTEGHCFIYLISCGFDSEDALKRVNYDYCLHHFINMLAQHVLFMMGRNMILQLKAVNSELLYRKHIITHPHGTGQHWDPSLVKQLYRFIEHQAQNVTLTDTGCFKPIHSLLGVAIGLPKLTNSFTGDEKR